MSTGIAYSKGFQLKSLFDYYISKMIGGWLKSPDKNYTGCPRIKKKNCHAFGSCPSLLLQ